MDQIVLTYFPSSKGKEQAHEITKMVVWFITVCLRIYYFWTSFREKWNERYATAGQQCRPRQFPYN